MSNYTYYHLKNKKNSEINLITRGHPANKKNQNSNPGQIYPERKVLDDHTVRHPSFPLVLISENLALKFPFPICLTFFQLIFTALCTQEHQIAIPGGQNATGDLESCHIPRNI